MSRMKDSTGKTEAAGVESTTAPLLVPRLGDCIEPQREVSRDQAPLLAITY
jgi:hypothetical protein